MMSSQSKDNNRDRKSKSIRLSQKLRGLRDLRLRVSIEGKPHLQRRGSLQESPQEEEDYRIVHTPDRPQRFISPVEAPTEDDCYDALRTWHHAAEQQRSGVHSYGIQQQRSGGAGEPGSTGVGGATNEDDDDDDGSRGSPFVPDPSDDAKTPKDEKWWELAYEQFKVVEGMNPFREWAGDHQQKGTQDQPDTNTRQDFSQDTAKGGPLQRGVAPPHLLTGLIGLPSKTYSTSEAGKNDIFNPTSNSKEEYTPPIYTPSQKSPTTSNPEMFPKAPTWTPGSPPAKSTTAAPETLLTREIQRARAIDSDSESTPPPGGCYFDIDEEYAPSGGSRTSSISCKPTATFVSDQQQHRKQLPSPPPPPPLPSKPLDNTGRGSLFPSVDFSSQATQTLHTELLKLAHKQHEQKEQQRGRGSGQSGESGQSGSTSSAFYSAFTSSPRPETPDVRPPSQRREQQQQQQQQAGPSLRIHEIVTETATPSTPRPKPKQTQQKGRHPMTAPRGLLKERGPYISPPPSGTASSSLRPPAPPPKTPETKAVTPKPSFLLNGLDFSPSRSVPPTPTPTPTKPKNMGSTGVKGVGGHMGGHIAGAVSISSLSSLSSLTGNSGVAITPPRVSLTKLKAPPPAPPPLPGGDEGGLLMLPKTVYNGNSKAKMPVKMPVPSLLSKFNTSHASSLTSRGHGPSTPDWLSSQGPEQRQIQGQERNRSQRGFPEFSIHVQPRINDPFVDSPSSDVDTLENRLSVVMVNNGLYDEDQAKAWNKTMAMMAQTQKPAHVQVYAQGQAKVRELKQGNTQSQKQVQGQGQAQVRSENLGEIHLSTQTQKHPKVQEEVDLASKIPSLNPPPHTPPPSTPPSQVYPLEPKPQTSSPGSQAYKPQSTPQIPPRFQAYQAQPALRTRSPRYLVLPTHSQSQSQSQQLQPAPSPSPHPSPAALSLPRTTYPGSPIPQSDTITPPLPQTPARPTPFYQHQPPPPSFRKQSTQIQKEMADAREKEQKNREQQQQQRPVSVGSDDGDSGSSYESLKFWKTPTPTPTPGLGMAAPVQRGTSSGVSRGNQQPGQSGQVGHEEGGRCEFKQGDEDEKEKEKKKKEEEERDDDDGDSTVVVETESGITGTGKGVTLSVVDDYADIIDQYAGGWRETMFFGEPEE